MSKEILKEESDKSELFVGLPVIIVEPKMEDRKKFGDLWTDALLKYVGIPKTISGRHECGYMISGANYVFPSSMMKPNIEAASITHGKSYGNETVKHNLASYFTGWVYYTKQRVIYFYNLAGHKSGFIVDQLKKSYDFSKLISFENNGLVVVINGKRFFQEEIKEFGDIGKGLLEFAPFS